MINFQLIKEYVLVFIKSSRPIGWFIHPLLFLFGFIQANASFSLTALFQLVLLSAPFCIFYALNDVYDYDSDRLNKRKGSIEGVKLKKRYQGFIKNSTFVVIFFLLLSSVLTFNVWNILPMIALLFFGYFYSAPPIRFKTLPPMDSFSNGLIYLFLPALLGFSFGKPLYLVDIKLFFLTGFIIGLHAFSTVMDYSSDKKVGDATFAVVFGKRSAIFFAFVTTLIILLFSNIKSALIKSGIIFCAIVFLFNLVLNKESFARRSFKAIFLVGALTALFYLFYPF